MYQQLLHLSIIYILVVTIADHISVRNSNAKPMHDKHRLAHQRSLCIFVTAVNVFMLVRLSEAAEGLFTATVVSFQVSGANLFT